MERHAPTRVTRVGLRQAATSAIPRSLRPYLGAFKRLIDRSKDHPSQFSLADIQQKTLVATWTGLIRQGIVLPLSQVGFKAYSQFEEDGLLLYLFTAIGTSNRKVVELGASDAVGSMATNLILHHGWSGYLFDANRTSVEDGQRFFERVTPASLSLPLYRQAWLTRENVNQVLADAGLEGEIDLLSIDLDGNDFWIWDAIRQVSPRVLIIETNNLVPTDVAVTVPYSADFRYSENSPEAQLFRGASGLAFVKLSARKGYRLIGAHRLGFNLIFMRNDVGVREFPVVDLKTVHDNPFTKSSQARWPSIANCHWQPIEE